MTDKIKEALNKFCKQNKFNPEGQFIEDSAFLFKAGYLAAQKELAEQKPVCWMTPDGEGWRMRTKPPENDVPLGWTPLYAIPPDQSALLENAYKQLKDLAESIFKSYFYWKDDDYKSGRVVWQVCDDLPGVISQLDNMFAGIRSDLADKSARIAELEAELSQLKTKPLHYSYETVVSMQATWATQLAAAQAENQKLREAAQNVCSANNYTEASQAVRILNTQLLTTPSDTSALESLLEAERAKTAEACAAMLGDGSLNLIASAMRDGEWKGFVK